METGGLAYQFKPGSLCIKKPLFQEERWTDWTPNPQNPPSHAPLLSLSLFEYFVTQQAVEGFSLWAPNATDSNPYPFPHQHILWKRNCNRLLRNPYRELTHGFFEDGLWIQMFSFFDLSIPSIAFGLFFRYASNLCVFSVPLVGLFLTLLLLVAR